MVQQFIHYAINSRLGLTGWVFVIVMVYLLFFKRNAGKIIVAIALLIVLILFAHSAVHNAEQRATADVNQATASVSNAIPDWMKQLWGKIDSHLPSAKDLAADKACDFAGISLACNIAKRDKQLLDQVRTDQNDIEAICKASPAVQRKFGDAGKTVFCAGNPFKQAHDEIKAIGAGILLGTADSISSFLVPDPKTLDTNQYLQCLYGKLKTRPDVNASSCTYTDPHMWRLCAEFHLQLPHETIGGQSASAPLDPDILACRKQAYNLQ